MFSRDYFGTATGYFATDYFMADGDTGFTNDAALIKKKIK